MDSFPILVDAGYVYAAGGMLVHNTTARHELILNPGKFRDYIEPFAHERSGGRLLRMYWYDAAPDRVPSAEQRHVASLQGVQLRLGRLTTRGVQKGVDSLIYRDLFTLSRTGRLSDVFLVAGDEDLLEGVIAAQEMGVRVSLIGIEPNDLNQSVSLRQAADAIYVLQREALSEMLLRRSRDDQRTKPVAQPHKLELLEARFSEPQPDRPTSDADAETIRLTSTQVATSSCEQASTDEVAPIREQLRNKLEPQRRRLPQRADGWLLRASGDQLSRLLTEPEKLLARETFWVSASAILESSDDADDAGMTEGREQ